ncbi:MAG TPA: hypothetical protein PLT36_07860 [Erysipelotrichaceae bacterium]|nr:hypothetical protein [Erysipelotrichaceae bacterium]HQA85872.1 hypothetical protein [Erysipelotrichaceae bacterium]
MRIKVGNLKYDGNGLYKDEYNQIFIVDKRNKRVYLIDDNDRKLVIFHQIRYLLPLLVFLLVGYFVDWIAGVILGIVVLIGLNIWLNRVYLKGLACVDNVEIPKQSHIKEKYLNTNNGNLIVLLVITILFPILLMINLFQTVGSIDKILVFETFNDFALIIGSIIAGVYSIYIAFTILAAIIEKRKM